VVDANVRQRLSVSKLSALKFQNETFNLQELNDVEIKKHYQVKISNRFEALKNMEDDYSHHYLIHNYDHDNDVGMNGAWESIRKSKNGLARSVYIIMY
jgi:hypothetical protein